MGFTLRDHKIRSRRIFQWAIVAINIITFSVLIAELLIDLNSTTLPVIGWLSAFTFLLTIISARYPNSSLARASITIIVFLFIEIHFLVNVKIFHVIIYWFPLIPMVALIVQSFRASQLWVLIVLITILMNSYILGQQVGEFYTISTNRIAATTIGIIFSISILVSSFLLYFLLGEAYDKMSRKTQELIALQSEVEKKNELLKRYQNNLIAFAKDENNFKHGQNELFRNICHTVAATLGVSRVSIWLMEERNTILIRKYLYELDNATDEVEVIYREESPTYFSALESKPFIMASIAKDHPDTIDFAKSYLSSLHIVSMLDCPILLDRKPVGVICCEQKFEIKNWNIEDALFTQSLSDFVALSFKNERIKNLLTKIRRQNFELVEKGNEIETMNGELNALNEELTTMNEQLEETVKRRTSQLATQNQQLTEYAFINSHLLRAPLSRVMGLSHLITREVTSTKDRELLDALVKATNELDAIVRKISDILYDGNNLSREDIKELIDRTLNKSV